jgi:hypothetical protein
MHRLQPREEVGLSISGQAFYTVILENLDKFGAPKAQLRSNDYLLEFWSGFRHGISDCCDFRLQ